MAKKNTPAVSPLQGVMPLSNGLSNDTTNIPVQTAHSLSKFISPVQLFRIKQDVSKWKEAIAEAEQAYFPQRIKMQRMFLDTFNNGHVRACMLKRKRLTLLRKFQFITGKDTVDETATKLFKTKWFKKFLSYSLDAQYYGYSLIALGDVVDGGFPNLKLVKRWNVSPDRLNVTSYIYSVVGKSFYDEDVKDWHVYVDTTSEDGVSLSGYGLFYVIALYEIFLRNILGFNGDFVQRFATPYVVGKTTKSDESERGELEQAIAAMGSAGYAIVDPQDDISFLEAHLAGTGWNGYDNLEKRCEAKISKLILGHEDGISSTPGKLGSAQGGEESPASIALEETQSEDGSDQEEIINNLLIPKLRSLGFDIPEGRFQFLNDQETGDARIRENNENLAVSTIATNMSKAGLMMSSEYFTKRTGIDCEAKPEPVATPPLDPKIKEKLNKLYI